jgi:hypothetical protein
LTPDWLHLTSSCLHPHTHPHTHPHRFLQAALETRFNAKALGHDLALTPYWNYIQLNGIGSLFYAYTWSLDVFVDFAW